MYDPDARKARRPSSRTALAAAVCAIVPLLPSGAAAAQPASGVPAARMWDQAPGRAAAGGCTKGACARRRARRQLSDRVFILFTETGTLGASLDQRLHLCRGGRFVQDAVSYLPETGTTSVQRTTGRWRVVSARLKRNGRLRRARVRGVPDDGTAVTITISVVGGTTRIDGTAVIVERSDVC